MYMYKFILVLLSAGMVVASVRLSAQGTPEVMPGERPSSSKSDLIEHKMGSVNNLSSGDLFTGSANISVPFYTQSKNNVNLGVGLNFNTKGVKVDEHSGNYGLHWGLSGGGYIIKYINDIEDEARAAFDENFMRFGSVTTYDSAFGKLVQPLVPFLRRGYRDKEYDEYHVSVGGYGFKFYIDAQGNYFIAPKHEAKVQRAGADFLITDIYGNRYRFKKSVDMESLKFMTNASYGNAADAMEMKVPQRIWVLEQVTFPNNEEVLFKYHTYSNAYFLYRYGMHEPGMGTGYATNLNKKPGGWEFPLLKEVRYANHDSLVLDYHTFSRCDLGSTPLLNTVNVYRNHTLLHYYKLHYSYVVSDANRTRLYVNQSANCNLPSDPFITGGDADEIRKLFYRIQLDSVNYHANSATFLPYFKFEYYNQEHLPPRLSAKQDYWGYYNGKNTDFPLNLIPKDLDAAGLDKAIDLTKMRVGNMRKVINGLGQAQEYIYDIADAYRDIHTPSGKEMSIAVNNPDPQFSSKLDAAGVFARDVCDGLRLVELITIDPTMPDGNKLHQKFDYRGAMQFLPGGRWATFGHESGNTIYASNRFSVGHLIGGSNTGYSRVTERTFNGAQQLLSRKETTFSNVVTHLGGANYENNYIRNGNTHYFEPPFTNKTYLKDYKIGLKLSEQTYDNLENLINEKQYKYIFREETFTPADNPTNINIQYRDYMKFYYTTDPMYIGGNGDSVFIPKYSDAYQVLTGKALLQEVQDINYYTDQRKTTDVTSYTYDDMGNLLKQRNKTEGGVNFYEKMFYYPKDFLNVNTAEARTIAQQLTDRNILNDVGYTVSRMNGQAANGLPLLVTDALFSTYTTSENGDLYVQSSSALKKGNRTELNTTFDFEKLHAEALMAAADDRAGYRSAFRVSKVNDWLQPLELQYRGINKYSTVRYHNVYKTEIASANTAYNDFAFISFEAGTDNEQVSYDVTKLTASATVGSRLANAQSGRQMLRLNPGDNIRVRELSAGKKYVIGCWVTNIKGTAPQALKVRTETGNIVTLELSRNHSRSWWYYFQGEVTLGEDEKLSELFHDGTEALWVDNIVMAPAGATYTIKSFNGRGLPDMEGGLNGKQVRYEYDVFDRLKVTRDENGNIKETFNYHISR